MVAQVIVRRRPILRDAPLAEQANGNIAVPGTGKRAIKRLQDAREPWRAGLGRIQMLPQFAMFSQIGETPQCERAFYREGLGGNRRRHKHIASRGIDFDG